MIQGVVGLGEKRLSTTAFTGGPPAGRLGRLSAPASAAVAAVLVCVAVRLWYLTSPQAALDGDEATTGIMARHILDGRLYAYLAGQRYNGAIEQYPQAALLALLPDTAFTLRLTQVAIAAVGCWLIYVAGARMLVSRWHAALAAVLFATGPFFNIWKGVRSHGAYGTGQMLGLLAMYAAIRVRDRERGDARAESGVTSGAWWSVVLGLCTGLALWACWSAAYLIVPALLYAAPPLVRSGWRTILGGLSALAIGYAPALAWALTHREVPLLGGPQPARTPWERLTSLVSPTLREFVGVGYRYGDPGWPVVVQYVSVAGLGVAYAVAVLRRLRVRQSRPTDMLLLTPPVVAILYAVSKYTWWTGEPRYLFVAYPAFALGIAAMVPRQRPRARNVLSSATAPRALAAVVLLLWVGTSATLLARHHDDGPRALPGCLRAAAGWLTARGIAHVYSDYWTGLPLQFYAGDRLLVGPVSGGRAKFPEARRAVDADPDPVYVAGHIRDPMDQEADQVGEIDAGLASHGIKADRTQVGCVVVYEHLRPPVRPWQLGVGQPMPGEPLPANGSG